MLRLPSGLACSCPGCLPPPLSSPCPSGVALPALLVVCRGVWRGVVCRAVVRYGVACRSSLVPRVDRRGDCRRSSSRYSVRAAGRLPCVARLGNRRGRRDGSLVAICLLGWGGRGSVWIMWSVLLSVDYFGRGGYIISRALMLFSPFFVSWHVLVMRAVLWSSAPIALVIAPIKRFLRGTTGAIFFCQFLLPYSACFDDTGSPAPHRVRAIALPASLHLIFSSHLSAACLRICFLLPGYSHINIAPLLAPLPSTRRTGRGMATIRMTGSGLMTACLLMR